MTIDDDLAAVLAALPQDAVAALAAMTRITRRLAVIEGMYKEKDLIEQIEKRGATIDAQAEQLRELQEEAEKVLTVYSGSVDDNALYIALVDLGVALSRSKGSE